MLICGSNCTYIKETAWEKRKVSGVETEIKCDRIIPTERKEEERERGEMKNLTALFV